MYAPAVLLSCQAAEVDLKQPQVRLPWPWNYISVALFKIPFHQLTEINKKIETEIKRKISPREIINFFYTQFVRSEKMGKTFWNT